MYYSVADLPCDALKNQFSEAMDTVRALVKGPLSMLQGCKDMVRQTEGVINSDLRNALAPLRDFNLDSGVDAMDSLVDAIALAVDCPLIGEDTKNSLLATADSILHGGPLDDLNKLLKTNFSKLISKELNSFLDNNVYAKIDDAMSTYKDFMKQSGANDLVKNLDGLMQCINNACSGASSEAQQLTELKDSLGISVNSSGEYSANKDIESVETKKPVPQESLNNFNTIKSGTASDIDAAEAGLHYV